jgi:hypothetical protein
MSTTGGSIHGSPGSVIGGSIGGHRDSVAAAPTVFAATVGDGVTTVFPVTHNLGTLDTLQEVYNPLTGAVIAPPAYTAVHTSANVTTFTFAAAPAAGAARVVIHS